jgi:SAM-dependent methyltransferase
MWLSKRLFHALTQKNYVWTPGSGRESAEWYEQSAHRFLDRFEGRIDVQGKTVLDVGTGTGELAAVLAREGAARVVGIDIQFSDRTIEELRDRYGAKTVHKVRLVPTTRDMHELGYEQFDMVFSKEAMEHYADPEAFVPLMVQRVKPGGQMVIGFGPLWKAYDGGHMPYMTKVPWAHLVFPEEVIMAERRRFRPQENATSFSEILGGLNKITLERFETIPRDAGLEPIFIQHNAGQHPAVRAMDQLARIRPLREYFTHNVHGIWRKPA